MLCQLWNHLNSNSEPCTISLCLSLFPFSVLMDFSRHLSHVAATAEQESPLCCFIFPPQGLSLWDHKPIFLSIRKRSTYEEVATFGWVSSAGHLPSLLLCSSNSLSLLGPASTLPLPTTPSWSLPQWHLGHRHCFLLIAFQLKRATLIEGQQE